ncbi:MAG: UDP-N-acetylmuramoyl-tripeptide--D-alanyl-D-alanine ligase [Planctomycetes bacterium]|nr:UDP-N-acetylmuramoyl-tripeptide--D-alanyl-D-alanine ligase [Planctomycetota bacterium]
MKQERGQDTHGGAPRARWTLADLAQAMGSRLEAGAAGLAVGGVSTDTRTLRPGDLFVALSGPNFDGARFIPAAVERGAVAVVVPEGTAAAAGAAPVLEVACTRRALGDLGRWVRSTRSLEVVGITGSCGKTSTKEILHVLLRGAGLRASASPASFNNDIGVPHTLLACPEDAQVLVAELGTNGRGEIAHLARLARPTGAIVTNVGASHLEGLGDEDGVASEKAALPASLPEGGFCVLNADCPRTAAMASVTRARVHRFAVRAAAAGEEAGGECAPDLVASDLTFEASGTSFTLSGAMVGEPGEEQRVSIPLLGRHQVQNVLAALTAGRALGVSLEALLAGLPDLAPVAGRGVRSEARGLALLDETYNANPTSTVAALWALAAAPAAGRRVAVLGRMHELGERSAALHAEVGAAVAAAGVDLLITVGADEVASGAREAGLAERALVRFADREAAAAGLEAVLHAGDLVLLKGSRAAGLDALVRLLQQSSPQPSGEPALA